MKNGKAIMLPFVIKFKNNFQFNQQPLGRYHRIDVWISDGRKPRQVLENVYHFLHSPWKIALTT